MDLKKVARRKFLKLAGALTAVQGSPSLAALIPSTRPLKSRRTFTEAEARTLGHMCEWLVPGALRAGVVSFVDQWLTVSFEECVLMIKYLDIPPPYAPLYHSLLDSVDRSSQRLLGKPVYQASNREGRRLIESLNSDSSSDWGGISPATGLFILRNDATDVVYGTPDGFSALGIPYRAHIKPPRAAPEPGDASLASRMTRDA